MKPALTVPNAMPRCGSACGGLSGSGVSHHRDVGREREQRIPVRLVAGAPDSREQGRRHLIDPLDRLAQAELDLAREHSLDGLGGEVADPCSLGRA